MFGRRLKEKRPAGLSNEEFEEYRNKDQMRMWRLPWGLWIMSFICFLAGSFLIASMTIFEILDPFEGDLWQYLIIISFYTFSGLFFIFASIEVITFDKEEKKIFKSKWILCYKWKSKIANISDVSDVTLTLKGKNDKYSNTQYYKINVILRSAKPIGALETKNRKKVIDKALKIRAFFGIKGKIPLHDYSTE
ncbi:hypothetical protein SteCoe_7600 [Stentor coeruleus]|uniref:Photosystem I assembly protein Ycf4 n=1 Tax=Stentor coeruleus TaxID=5963 RepID=A0A1R2CM68_9CILI|nr:hypothetical protein SteCoe_7600 [Stentor coeruleus]